MNNSRKKAVIVLAILIMIAVTLSLVASTYARYTATVSRNGTVTVAKWAFSSDNSGSTTMNINFADTYHPSTLVANNANSEVGVEYTVSLGTVTNAPTNIKFYSDATYSTEITATTPITGKMKANETTAQSVKIYWAWPYQTGAMTGTVAAGDAADTADGIAAKNLTVPVTITGVQVQPSATAIP